MMTRTCKVVLLLAASFGPRIQASELVEQSFQLHPGFNAIYLEVEPQPTDPAGAFAGVPVESVWTRILRTTSVGSVQGSTEDQIKRDSWLAWFPDAPRGVSNLFILQANRAYLIKLTGTETVTWTISGRPSLRTPTWIPDALNLTGLPVNPDVPVKFADYFEPSPSHNGQASYRISADAVPSRVNGATDNIQSGSAYWVFCRGPSDYSGPLSVSLDTGDGLDYGRLALEQRLHLRNLASAPTNVELRVLDSAAAGQLAYWNLKPNASASETRIQWPDLPQTLNLPTPSDAPIPCASEAFSTGDVACSLRLAVQRANFTSDSLETVIEVSNSMTRRWIPVSALSGVEGSSGSSRGANGREAASSGPNANSFEGLWVGTVEVNAVSEAQTVSTVPTPVSTEFSFRIFVHVDAMGKARLLKEVFQMWKNGTLNPDGTVATRGRYVILNDEEFSSQFVGASLRDGVPVPVRISTVAYDFAENAKDFAGTFGSSLDPLTLNLVLDANAPTNPYRHKFHPDHEEAFTIERAITLSFSDSDPTGADPPDWAESVTGGTYSETVNGLHRNDIHVSGRFQLTRASYVDVLNQ